MYDRKQSAFCDISEPLTRSIASRIEPWDAAWTVDLGRVSVTRCPISADEYAALTDQAEFVYRDDDRRDGSEPVGDLRWYAEKRVDVHNIGPNPFGQPLNRVGVRIPHVG